MFTLGDLSKVSYACADASMWTGIETRESVEPLVYCVDELRYINLYFKARYDYHAKITKEDAEEIERLVNSLIEALEREMELF